MFFNTKLRHGPSLLEDLIVAPPYLDMCLDIFGAWINQKKSFDWDIILENIALFANTF